MKSHHLFMLGLILLSQSQAKEYSTGEHKESFDVHHLPAGLYLMELNAGNDFMCRLFMVK